MIGFLRRQQRALERFDERAFTFEKCCWDFSLAEAEDYDKRSGVENHYHRMSDAGKHHRNLAAERFVTAGTVCTMTLLSMKLRRSLPTY
jgi:hypothetical protein